MKIYKTFGQSHSPRLKQVDYTRINYPAHLIVGTRNREPVFSKDSYARIVVTELMKIEGFIVTWCLMHDHLHLLFDPEGENRNLIEIVKMIKGRSSWRINKVYGKSNIWQESFYDHILRKNEEIEEVALYILNNPVRKGLVSNWEEYPYSWSKYHSCGVRIYPDEP